MGHLSNVQLLLSLGCDVNSVSVGKHNYGKTGIFYAITRGRNDVVRHLLECDGGKEIPNNIDSADDPINFVAWLYLLLLHYVHILDYNVDYSIIF